MPVWTLAAAAFVFAAFCGISLTWDGSYYLFHTLQDGRPMMPHRRWFNWFLETPVLWASAWVDAPASLAVVAALTRSLLPLFSLAACLGMLRGSLARIRIWAVIGILLVPFPGLLPIVSEATLTLQLSWVVFAFAWSGCPKGWSPSVIFSTLAMLTLHPSAAPLLFIAAVVTAALAQPAPPGKRRMWAWSLVFAILSVSKLIETLLLATSYERDNMHAAAWLSEVLGALFFTPFPVLVPIFVERAVTFWTERRGISIKAPDQLRQKLWGLSFVLGIICTFDVSRWASELSYRKFGFLVAIPAILMATVEVLRPRRAGPSSGPVSPELRLFVPAALFALMLVIIGVRWKQLCQSISNGMATRDGRVMFHSDLREPEAHSALDHWSTTSLSLLLQGWQPKKIFIWNAGIQCVEDGFFLCPGDVIQMEDGKLSLGWVEPAVKDLAGKTHNE